MAKFQIKSVEALPGFVLKLEFVDGTKGTICVRGDLTGPMFEGLRDEREFAKVTVDEFGAVSWPNGADMAPDRLYEDVQAAARAA